MCIVFIDKIVFLHRCIVVCSVILTDGIGCDVIICFVYRGVIDRLNDFSNDGIDCDGFVM